MNCLKKYFPELLGFGAIFAILMTDLNPDFTFVNKAADSIGYIYSAKYLYPSFHTSSPLYLLLSHLFLMIPLGTDAWRMALLSVLSTMVACVFLYLIIRKLTNKRLYALLGILAYGTGTLVLSQSIIVQTYALVTMLAIGAYYFALNKRWKLTALMLGMGLATHLLGVIVFLLMLIFRDYRRNWRALLISISFGLFYLYAPITNRPPYMWFPDPSQANRFLAFIGDILGIIEQLIGTVSIWDLPKRILDTIGIVGLSIGIITIVPIIYFIKVTGKKIFKNPLFWLAVTPTIIFISELDMNTYDYTMVSIPFLLIMACLGLKLMVERHKVKAQVLVYATLIVIIGLGTYNALYFDIGRTLDKNMSASKLYYEEFPKIPDGAIFMSNSSWTWESIYLYNREHNLRIYPICIDIIPSENYRNQLEKDGIKLIWSDNPNMSIAQAETARSIVELNDNIWTTILTDPSTFGTVIVPANHNSSLIIVPDQAKITDISEHPTIHWIPDNPYSIITTSITVEKWTYVLYSNYNLRLFFELGMVGLFIYWILFMRNREKENT